MGKKDPRVDAYIEGVNPFARPILKRLRKWTHQYCPGCEETLKWSAPHFEYKGKMYCGMSAFKEHCAFGFWHPMMRRNDNSVEGMGSFGKIRSLADLPSEGEFAKMAAEAMRLTDDRLHVQPQEGVRGVDHGSEARGNTRGTRKAGGRVDGRGQGPALEIHALGV